MSKSSFRSFKDLLKELPDLSETVPNISLYLGHTPAKNSLATKPEPLTDHINLVNKTAWQLIRLHGLEKVIDRLITKICKQLNIETESGGNFIKRLFFAAITFHDFGKLNENFQVEKMNNKEQFAKASLLIGSRHSILSAYLFLNYYLKQLEAVQIDTNKKTVLAGIICSFADPILKHHSSSFDVGDMDSKECDELNRFLKFVGLFSSAEHLKSIIDQKRDFEETIYARNKGLSSYPLFTLLKLNFSLLTASDYLATLCYQYNTELPDIDDMDWWGIFSQERKIELYDKFKNSENYNHLALDNPEELTKKSMNSLQERSPKNLNHLRSKLLGEVILKLRENKQKRLFYLKAPTGAGKTNISLATAIEMLQDDKNLNKILYVFPFTTLITQTFDTILDTLDIGNDEVVQLHSKAEWNTRKSEEQKDGLYSREWINHVDNLFVHYPFVLLSHVRFFDILKGNQKEINYLLHRMANSIVIIDELQSYNPKFWDHVNYFITHYAESFNIRFILMSATLPEIGKLALKSTQEWTELISDSEQYFQNDNFASRVSFDFTLLEQEFEGKNELSELADFLAERSEGYAVKDNNSEAKIIIEFITKKSATDFAKEVENHPILSEYRLLMMTGTILETRRVQVKRWLECEEWLEENPKVLLISTQVVEAGANIDMDLGFKDTSLIDSDEQLAGRVNRNAKKSGNKVYLFNLDSEGIVYQNDERLKIQHKELSFEQYKEILNQKDFNKFYNRIIEKHLNNRDELIHYFRIYLEHLQSLRFSDAHYEFQLIDDNTIPLFIPLSIPANAFSEEEQILLEKAQIQANSGNEISGKDIFKLYKHSILDQSKNFIENRDGIKRIQSLLSKFSISVYSQTAKRIERIEMEEHDQNEPYRFGYLYCSGYKVYYRYEIGLILPKEENRTLMTF